jgi:pyruvate dehydrogenase E2 component (dihydrolipoamide acetyltransferase)
MWRKDRQLPLQLLLRKPIPANFFRDTSGVEPQDERQPVRGLRRVIAQAMVRSKYTAPHYSYVDKFECSQLVAMREEAKKVGEQYGVKISYLPFIVKALVGALKEFPTANASLEESDKGMELVLKKHYHIGIAVATPDGLIVPVIKNADRKTILQIAQEINDLSAKVRAGKATADELKGSTFTITSMGNIGGLFATPIINYPEVGIMGVYKVQEEPLVQDGQIVIGKTMHLSLSLDHRVVDGAVGGYFCNAVIERLQNPARLLMEMI